MAALSAEEVKQYDRQIRLWGYERQLKLTNSLVCLSGVDGVTMEVGKNLAAAGVNIALSDDRLYDGALVSIVPRPDMFAVDGATQAEWYLRSLRKMNQLVKLSTISESGAPDGCGVVVMSVARRRPGAGLQIVYAVYDDEVVVAADERPAVIEAVLVDAAVAQSTLTPAECAVVGGLIAQVITSHIQGNPADWNVIRYDRRKLMAVTAAHNPTTVPTHLPDDVLVQDID